MIEMLKYKIYLIINKIYFIIFKKSYIEKNLYFILEKWNWWTPTNKKYKIDIDAKIEYMLLNANYNNMKILNKYINKDNVLAVWNKIQTNTWDFKTPKRNLINNYLNNAWK